ncbi:hypothetical protein J2T04_002998 [Chryseobacterium lathyri]|uniref:Uncharacterized protein n=1 Tax=Chryseobacterium lathyri TaxID=395933 RepID=A0ABT9SNV1_9FLAO|nr:hypothetical protein [Chryseobacterium lathyri]
MSEIINLINIGLKINFGQKNKVPEFLESIKKSLKERFFLPIKNNN